MERGLSLPGGIIEKEQRVNMGSRTAIETTAIGPITEWISLDNWAGIFY
jgi:hypothetical protein